MFISKGKKIEDKIGIKLNDKTIASDKKYSNTVNDIDLDHQQKQIINEKENADIKTNALEQKPNNGLKTILEMAEINTKKLYEWCTK